MRITKKPVSASIDLDPTSSLDNCSVYECASSRILEAINCLGSIAATDSNAREAIANLSVVLLDMKTC